MISLKMKMRGSIHLYLGYPQMQLDNDNMFSEIFRLRSTSLTYKMENYGWNTL